jgi:rRNA maturation endonuclease Nob1
MKVWYGYGTEHSMNLVMIGRFEDATTAERAHVLIKELTTALQAEEEAGRLTVGEPNDRYSDEVLKLLSDLNIHSIGPREIEQFLYDLDVRRDGDSIVVTTDETDVQALLKVLIDKGARIELYSAHDHPGTGYGRGK